MWHKLYEEDKYRVVFTHCKWVQYRLARQVLMLNVVFLNYFAYYVPTVKIYQPSLQNIGK